MKSVKIIVMAMLIALTTTGMAMAAGSVQVNEVIAVATDVQNSTGQDMMAAVKLRADDNVGNAVGHLCREVVIPANGSTTVNYLWRAPAYETGLYWSATIVADGTCENHDTDDTDSDSDSDSDGDSDDSDD